MNKKLGMGFFVMIFSLRINNACAMNLDDTQSEYDNVSVISMNQMPPAGSDMKVRLLPNQKKKACFRCTCNGREYKTNNPIVGCCGCITTMAVGTVACLTTCVAGCGICLTECAKEACCPRK